VVLKKAAHFDGLAKGLREVCRAIVKKQLFFVVLADDCTESKYKDLVKALCAENKVSIIDVPEQKTLGEWVGLCKYDKQNKIRKKLRCTSVAVRDFGVESEELNFVLNYIKETQKSENKAHK